MSDTRPNVLFFLTDQLRPDYLGVRDDVPVETPNVDRLIDRGVQFTDAVCPSPVCNPSRASIASGMEYDRCGVRGNNVDYPPCEPTLYGRLRDEGGYHVMGCGKFDLQSGFPCGLSGNHKLDEYGFSDGLYNPALNNTVHRFESDVNGDPRDPYTQYLAEEGLLQEHVEDYRRRREEGVWTATFPTPLPQEAYYDDWITRNGLSLLADAPDDQPWFLEVSFQNPHHPWDVTEEMHGWYRDPNVEFPGPVECDLDVAPETHQEVRRNYAAMVEHLDRCVGRFLERLAERGELDETLVVFTSDHGEMLGDYGLWQKLAPHHASVGVPFVAAGPGVDTQSPRDEPTTILDLHATFLDYAGVAPGDVDSRSLRSAFDGGAAPREVVYSGLSSWRMVYDGEHKLVRGYDPECRVGDEYEPMRAAPENVERRLRERQPILHDVGRSESENVVDERPEVTRRLERELEAFRSGAK
ncbi:MAG: sulfatase [Halobacteriaceae archaeon]